MASSIRVKVNNAPQDVKQIKVGSSNVKDVKVGNRHIWCQAPVVSSNHLLSQSATKNNIGVRLTNNSAYTITYYITSPSYPNKTGSLVLGPGETGTSVFATVILVPNSLNWNISYLDCSYTAVTSGNGGNQWM